MLMPAELIALWIFLSLLSCGAVWAYVRQRSSNDTPRANLTVSNRRELQLLPLVASRHSL